MPEWLRVFICNLPIFASRFFFHRPCRLRVHRVWVSDVFLEALSCRSSAYEWRHCLWLHASVCASEYVGGCCVRRHQRFHYDALSCEWNVAAIATATAAAAALMDIKQTFMMAKMALCSRRRFSNIKLCVCCSIRKTSALNHPSTGLQT